MKSKPPIHDGCGWKAASLTRKSNLVRFQSRGPRKEKIVATVEQAQQTKYRITLASIITVCVAVVIVIGTYLSYVYPDASVTPKVLKHQDLLATQGQALEVRVGALEKRVKDLEEFKKDISLFLELKKRITE